MDQQEDTEITDDLHTLITRIHATSNRDLLNAIAREQLSFSQLQLLERLRGGRVRPTIQEASRIMFVTPAGASRLIDSLAQRGLLHRETDDNDSRRKRLVITDKGEQAIVRLHAARIDGVERFVDELPAGQRDRLHAAIKPIIHHDQEQDLAAA